MKCYGMHPDTRAMIDTFCLLLRHPTNYNNDAAQAFSVNGQNSPETALSDPVQSMAQFEVNKLVAENVLTPAAAAAILGIIGKLGIDALKFAGPKLLAFIKSFNAKKQLNPPDLTWKEMQDTALKFVVIGVFFAVIGLSIYSAYQSKSSKSSGASKMSDIAQGVLGVVGVIAAYVKSKTGKSLFNSKTEFAAFTAGNDAALHTIHTIYPQLPTEAGVVDVHLNSLVAGEQPPGVFTEPERFIPMSERQGRRYCRWFLSPLGYCPCNVFKRASPQPTGEAISPLTGRATVIEMPQSGEDADAGSSSSGKREVE